MFNLKPKKKHDEFTRKQVTLIWKFIETKIQKKITASMTLLCEIPVVTTPQLKSLVIKQLIG